MRIENLTRIEKEHYLVFRTESNANELIAGKPLDLLGA